MSIDALTQKRLKEIIRYSKSTGVFTWTKTRQRARKGQVAGGLNWSGYVRISIDNQRYQAHRLAFLYVNGSFPAECTDHINGVKADNRWVNLRGVSHSENLKNTVKSKKNTSGSTGVTWNKRKRKWQAQIHVNGKNIYLGRFSNKKEAIKVRKDAEPGHGFHKNHGRNPNNTPMITAYKGE